MFDITSSKLLILGIVALLVIGPKDLPALLRTIGKYMGIIKRHANDFRAQFDEAMRESELDQIKKQVETVGEEAQSTMRAAEAGVEKQLADARSSANVDLGPDPFAAHDAGGMESVIPPAAPLNGTAHPAEPAPEIAKADPPAPADRAPEKSGA